MKIQILFCALFMTTFSYAQSFEKRMEAVVRTESNKPSIDEVILTDLTSDSSFDGEFFRIVNGKSDEAISFDSDKELRLRAATTYHHLTIARNYFVNQVKSDYVKAIPKIIIRIEHKNQFSELGHFANDNLEPQSNNALTIPAGKGLASKGVKPWGIEIWFRPKERIHLRDLKVNNGAHQEMQVLMKSFRNQVHMQSLQRFMSQTVIALTEDSARVSPFSLESVVRTVGSSLFMEAGFQFIDPLSKALARKWYWLDTALVPEIIYHEYAHVALSDHLVLSHSTPIIEGMADFFAGQIANSPKLANRIKKYNTYNGKNAKKKQEYKLQFESNQYANTDFVFGLLWQLKKIIGNEKAEVFMFLLRTRLTTNSSIRGQLVDGILTTCDEVCDQPFVDKLRILKELNLKGL